MAEKIQHNEAEYAGFVDQGTRTVLQEAIGKIVENFSQTEELEDIISYLEEMRDSINRTDERVKEVQQKEKQLTDKMNMVETSVRNLLQRIQEMEVQVAEATETVSQLSGHLVRLTQFFEQPPLKRAFGRLGAARSQEEEEEYQNPTALDESKGELPKQE